MRNFRIIPAYVHREIHLKEQNKQNTPNVRLSRHIALDCIVVERVIHPHKEDSPISMAVTLQKIWETKNFAKVNKC